MRHVGGRARVATWEAGRPRQLPPSSLLFGGGEFHGVGDIFITATSISDRVVTFARVVGAAMGGGA
jgi:hypothetical protein